MKKKTSKKIPYKLIGAVTGLTLVALGLLGFGIYVNRLPEEIFVNKTTVTGLFEEDPEIVGLYTTFAELETATESWLNTRLSQPLQLQSERGTASVTLDSLGVSPDWERVRPELGDYMASSGPFEKVSTYLFGQTVEVPVVIDEETLNLTLSQTGIEQGNRSAYFKWDNEVLIEPAQIGYGIEKEPLLLFLEGVFSYPALPTEVPLTLRISEPKIMDEDLTAILPDAQELAQKTVTFQDEFGNTWDLDFQSHLDLIVPMENGPMASNEWRPWTLDQTLFITYAETVLVPEVEEEPTGVVITENEDGSYSFEGSARFGKELDKLALYDTLVEKVVYQAVVPAEEVLEEVVDPFETPITLPVTTVDPSITVPDSLAAMGVTDLVGLGYSDFSGSPTNRVHNIETGIAQFNGVLIEQGAEFSFMGHMSPVDAANGFRTELVIKGDETIPEYGGGLCQISSTMFRAALYSGLPITARRNHSYAVSYYARPFGYGLDATVYDPAPDFKFVNDTAGALLVQAYTDGSSAFYVFYGTNDGRTVTMEGPYSYNYNTVDAQTTYTDKLAPGERELKEYSHTGFTTDWYRTVTYQITEAGVDEEGNALYVSPYAAEASGVKELFRSVYEARPAKYWEGVEADSELISEE